MKELEDENVRQKRLVADLSLEKKLLKDFVFGNLQVSNSPGLAGLAT